MHYLPRYGEDFDSDSTLAFAKILVVVDRHFEIVVAGPNMG
jgi:hypothetical protein